MFAASGISSRRLSADRYRFSSSAFQRESGRLIFLSSTVIVLPCYRNGIPLLLFDQTIGPRVPSGHCHHRLCTSCTPADRLPLNASRKDCHDSPPRDRQASLVSAFPHLPRCRFSCWHLIPPAHTRRLYDPFLDSTGPRQRTFGPIHAVQPLLRPERRWPECRASGRSSGDCRHASSRHARCSRSLSVVLFWSSKSPMFSGTANTSSAAHSADRIRFKIAAVPPAASVDAGDSLKIFETSRRCSFRRCRRFLSSRFCFRFIAPPTRQRIGTQPTDPRRHKSSRAPPSSFRSALDQNRFPPAFPPTKEPSRSSCPG